MQNKFRSLLNPPLVARRGGELRVVGVARISTVHQDERSLADQEAYYRDWLEQHTDLPIALTTISSRASGEILDRAELQQLETLVESGEIDLVLAEDLGRIIRRTQAIIFCELCEDHDTRLITINDHVDTGTESWRLHSMFASMRHEQYNADTSKRIRRSLRNRFQNGGVIQFTIFGYLKPLGAKSDAELLKDPTAEAIYEQWFQRLENGDTYQDVADWLNAQKVPVGPYSRQSFWSVAMVARITRNPILKGIRQRNNKVSRRINKTGRRKSVNAPAEELLERDCPHLAFVSAERFDRLQRMLKERNAKYRRKEVEGKDPLFDRPKKRSRWPGQQLFCGVCGRLLVYGAHGQANALVCSGARDYRCWNSISVSGPLAAQKLSEAIFNELAALPLFDQELQTMVEQEYFGFQTNQQERTRPLKKKLEQLERELTNLTSAIAASGHSPTLLQRLQMLEVEQQQVQDQLYQMNLTAAQVLPSLPNLPTVRDEALVAFQSLALDSWEFAKQMRRCLPPIMVYPCQAFGGGKPGLRARFEFSLAQFDQRLQPLTAIKSGLTRHLTVDLFELPQRVKHRTQILELRAEGLTEREVAQQLGITITAAQQASTLSRLMVNNGLSDPYIELLEPPANHPKLRRHRHPRYCFTPLIPRSEVA